MVRRSHTDAVAIHRQRLDQPPARNERLAKLPGNLRARGFRGLRAATADLKHEREGSHGALDLEPLCHFTDHLGVTL